ALLKVRLGGPHQERSHVLRVLRHGLRRTVGIVHAAVGERRRHGDGVAGKILVVIEPGRNGDAGRRLVLVALQQRRQVVRALLLVHAARYRQAVDGRPRKAAVNAARLGDYRLIDRKAAVARAGRLLVGKRRRKTVGQPAGPLEHLTLVVGPVLDLVFRRDGGGLRRGKFRAAGLGEIAKRHQRKA